MDVRNPDTIKKIVDQLHLESKRVVTELGAEKLPDDWLYLRSRVDPNTVFYYHTKSSIVTKNRVYVYGEE